jgi:hypothetical protein
MVPVVAMSIKTTVMIFLIILVPMTLMMSWVSIVAFVATISTMFIPSPMVFMPV